MTTTKVLKAALYIRVSTQEQVENYSIESQRERLEAYCKSKGWTVYETYIDGGYSGSNIDRPALKQLLDDLDNIDVVVVYRLDRLSRSQRDTLTLIEDHFLKKDVDFVSITETLDTSTPFGKAMIGILSVFAQLERETITERMRLGQIKRAEEGLAAMGGDYDPAGYDRKDGKLIVKPNEAEHIKRVFDLYEQYLSITKVQGQLRKEGFPVWRFRRYRDILRNKLYCGYVSYSGEHYKGVHDAIITEEQYDRVQVLLSRHRGRNAHKAKRNIFTGLVVCGHCGENYTAYSSYYKKNDATYRYLICRARRYPAEYEEKCFNKTWRIEHLEEIITNRVAELYSDKSQGLINKHVIDYSQLLRNTDSKIERVLSLYAEGTISKDLLDKQISKLDGEKRSLLQEKKNSKLSLMPTKEELINYHANLKGVNFSERQAVLQKLVRGIEIDDETIKIEWFF